MSKFQDEEQQEEEEEQSYHIKPQVRWTHRVGGGCGGGGGSRCIA